MVGLNGHEAGNGGHSQGKPTAYPDASTRREVCVSRRLVELEAWGSQFGTQKVNSAKHASRSARIAAGPDVSNIPSHRTRPEGPSPSSRRKNVAWD